MMILSTINLSMAYNIHVPVCMEACGFVSVSLLSPEDYQNWYIPTPTAGHDLNGVGWSFPSCPDATG